MARSTVVRITSDLSGKEVPEDQAWTMELTPSDGRRNKFQRDLTDEEAQGVCHQGARDQASWPKAEERLARIPLRRRHVLKDI